MCVYIFSAHDCAFKSRWITTHSPRGSPANWPHLRLWTPPKVQSWALTVGRVIPIQYYKPRPLKNKHPRKSNVDWLSWAWIHPAKYICGRWQRNGCAICAASIGMQYINSQYTCIREEKCLYIYECICIYGIDIELEVGKETGGRKGEGVCV